MYQINRTETDDELVLVIQKKREAEADNLFNIVAGEEEEEEEDEEDNVHQLQVTPIPDTIGNMEVGEQPGEGMATDADATSTVHVTLVVASSESSRSAAGGVSVPQMCPTSVDAAMVAVGAPEAHPSPQHGCSVDMTVVMGATENAEEEEDSE